MKWLITGGTGLIGQSLAHQLSSGGDIVHIISRNPSKSNLFTHPNIHFFTGNILDPATLVPAMTGCDGVFHLAAYAKGWAKDKQTYFNHNVTGTKNVIVSARECDIPRVVFTSTAGILGPAGSTPKTEDEGTDDLYLTEYEKSKLQAKQLALECTVNGPELIIIYPTRVFGPGPLQDSNAITRIIKWYSEGKWHYLPGNGKITGNYVFVDDMAKGLWLAMKKGRSRESYILGGENLSFREMFHIIGQQTGKERKLLPLPLPLMRLIVMLFTLGSWLTGKAPIINMRWLNHYMQMWQFSSDKARKELGYQPHSFAEGVALTWEFLQHQKK